MLFLPEFNSSIFVLTGEISSFDIDAFNPIKDYFDYVCREVDHSPHGSVDQAVVETTHVLEQHDRVSTSDGKRLWCLEGAQEIDISLICCCILPLRSTSL